MVKVFLFLKKKNKWLKIKIKEDNYKGYIQRKNYLGYIKPTHKVNKLNAKIYKSSNKRVKINELTFGSKIKVTNKKSQFFKFTKGWVNRNDVSIISFKEKNTFSKVKIFKNLKYKWGGKSFKGIDCTVVVVIFFSIIIITNSYK